MLGQGFRLMNPIFWQAWAGSRPGLRLSPHKDLWLLLLLLLWLEGKAHLQDLPPLRPVLLGLLLGMHEPCQQPCYQGPGAM